MQLVRRVALSIFLSTLCGQKKRGDKRLSVSQPATLAHHLIALISGAHLFCRLFEEALFQSYQECVAPVFVGAVQFVAVCFSVSRLGILFFAQTSNELVGKCLLK